MHKNTKLLPYERKEIFRQWGQGKSVVALAREYKVSRQTIYATVKDARLGIFLNRTSTNHRYQTILYGLKQMKKTERVLARKLADRERRQNRYEKAVPGEMVHLDTKRLPLLIGEGVRQAREYLFVAVDDHSRFLFADIFPDKTGYSAAIFLEEVRHYFPIPLSGIYSDNGSEYKGKRGHPVYDLCRKYHLSQGLTKVKHPWTNGKAERVIKTLMTEWHSRTRSNHISRDHRRRHLYAYLDWYNQCRIHQSLGKSPLERLADFYGRSVNNA